VADELAQIATWRESVDELVAECCECWELRPGAAYVPGFCGHALRVECADGTPAVLKVYWAGRESEQEADALERWEGEGAVRLYARDDVRSALLLERCEPGTFLSSSPDALDVLIGLLPRLWIHADGFHTLADEAEHWLERGLRNARHGDVAVGLLRELAPTQGEQVLVHQDLHGENVLAAEREPWLVIDPKPLAGEREFAVAPIVRSFELGNSKRDVLYRLDRLCSELGLDRERARGWTVAQTVAWSSGSVADRMELVEWLL
jgi:streptomycin 6-kinase